MKIINDTGNTIAYLVTPSGTVLSGSPIIASGYVVPNGSIEFVLTNAGVQPLVYVKAVGEYTQGNISRQVANGNSVVRIGITED